MEASQVGAAALCQCVETLPPEHPDWAASMDVTAQRLLWET